VTHFISSKKQKKETNRRKRQKCRLESNKSTAKQTLSKNIATK